MDNTLYWLFSTVVQAYVALLALVGMVGIYRISTLERLLDEQINNMETVYSPDSFKLYQYPSREEKMSIIIDKINSQTKPSEKGNKIKVLHSKATSDNKKLNNFKINFIVFSIVTFIDVILSLIFLGYTTTLAELPLIYISIIIISVIILSLLSLLSAILLVIRAIMPHRIIRK